MVVAQLLFSTRKQSIEKLFSWGWGVEEDISSIYQMPEINPDIRHSALFLTSSAACRRNRILRAALKEDSALDAIAETTERIAR